MEPESSLPQSQMPAICPYPEPARSSHILHPTSEDPSQYYHPIYTCVSQVVSLLHVSSRKPILHLPFPP